MNVKLVTKTKHEINLAGIEDGKMVEEKDPRLILSRGFN